MNEIFAKAAEYISEHGHCKHNLTGPGGTVCAIGALAAVREAEGDGRLDVAWDNAVNRAGDVLKERFPVDRSSPYGIVKHPLAQFNDADDTTAEDVILFFKELAHEAE